MVEPGLQVLGIELQQPAVGFERTRGLAGFGEGLTEIEERIPGIGIEADGGFQMLDRLFPGTSPRQESPEVVVGARVGWLDFDRSAIACSARSGPETRERHAVVGPQGAISGIDLQGFAQGFGGLGKALIAQGRGAGRHGLAAAGAQSGHLLQERIGKGHPAVAIARERRPGVDETPQLAVGQGQGGADLRGTGLAGERSLEVPGRSGSIPSRQRQPAEAKVGGGQRQSRLERLARLSGLPSWRRTSPSRMRVAGSPFFSSRARPSRVSAAWKSPVPWSTAPRK